MLSALRHTDDALRGRVSTTRLVLPLVLIGGYGLVYGAVMGSFGGVLGRGAVQAVYSAVKVPLLLLATFCLSLPTFFVVNSLMGLRDDFAPAVRALLATQAGLTIVLASLAPFTVLWYVSFPDYDNAVLFNAVMFGLASLASQVLLRRHYRPLIQRDPRHRTLMLLWLVIYAFIGIQMGWVLRPFIGNPDLPPTFFREEAWGNAYVIVFNKVMGAVR